jgi:hypothetical protein
MMKIEIKIKKMPLAKPDSVSIRPYLRVPPLVAAPFICQRELTRM